MTKKEVKRLLYSFLMENGILVQYYYNCIHYQDNRALTDKRLKMLSLPKKQRLGVLFDDVFETYLLGCKSKNLDGFFNFRTHAFTWNRTPEGFEYWNKWYRKWEVYINKHGYEYKKEIICR